MPQVQQPSARPAAAAGRRRVVVLISVIVIVVLVVGSVGLFVNNLASGRLTSGIFKPSISTFPSKVFKPTSMASGTDGNLWFTSTDDDAIGKITQSGSVTKLNLSKMSSHSITAGRDGNMWFIAGPRDLTGFQIGRVTPRGQTTFWPLPAGSLPGDLAAGPDGNLWFTDTARHYGPDPGDKGVPENKIGRVTMEGVTNEFALPTPDGDPNGITPGPDGTMWFTESRKIGRIDPLGSIREFALPAGSSSGQITLGPDGALWFTSGSERDARIGRITPAGSVTQFSLPPCEQVCNRSLRGITAGPDGNVWFSESKGYGEGNVWSITPRGSLTSYAVNGWASGITTGADGNVWFTEELEDTIARVNIKTR
jgi:virginiamycin B lyase